MHYYMLTISEETESEFKSELQVWENREGKLWIQIGDEPMEPHGVHGMTLTKDDAVALIKELTRLVGYVPTQQIKTEQPKINQASTEGKSRFINQPPTSDQPAQQLTIDGSPTPPSKVNWAGK